ncbi:MAG: polar amino acid transport system permease protein, partial [Caballeronia sp.]|nr:polar amino acid transport system permease protein [Caballeronia sp.]
MLSASSDLPSDGVIEADSTQLEYVRRRHWGRYIASAVILAIVVYIGLAFAHGQIEWRYVARFLTAKSILTGLVNTIVMTVLAMALGVALGVVTAIMRLSTNPVLQTVAQAYVWLFRGTPVILQLLLWFNLALVFPSIGLPGLFEFRTVDVMTPFLAAL